ncbi:hypothetical protein N8843_07400 [Verrucomicrobia bacterium]|nr:hypothetical protein [Verrucomicrobiota bacterium]
MIDWVLSEGFVFSEYGNTECHCCGNNEAIKGVSMVTGEIAQLQNDLIFQRDVAEPK